MEKREQSGSGGRTDWAVRLSGMIGGAAGAALALLLGPLADIRLAFWPGLIAFCAATVVGGVLGRFAGSLLFRPPPAGGPR